MSRRRGKHGQSIQNDEGRLLSASLPSLHLLLTVDSLNDVTEVQTLLLKCRNIVTTLHFKSYVIEEQLVATADRAEVDKLFARISAVSEVAELYNFPVVKYDEQGYLLSPHAENREVEHRHTTVVSNLLKFDACYGPIHY